jgi:hypothetical protein
MSIQTRKADSLYNPEYADLPFNADVETEENDISPEAIQDARDRRNALSASERHLLGED